MGVVDDQVDRLIERVVSSPHRLTSMDSFIGARAILLLGWNSNISFCTSGHLKSMSNQNLALLANAAQSCGNLDFGSRVSKILAEKLADNLNSFSTTDLISSVGCLASLTNHRSITSVLKSCATELVRRIELGFVSPHSCVLLIEYFSGNPPAPIHPLLLQAAYAFLLTNWNYKSLSREEVSRVVHASVLSEIENLVLTPILVREFVCRTKARAEDPRIALRMMAAISLSKSGLADSLIHSVSRDISVANIKSVADASILSTAFLNALYNGVCLEKVDEFLQTRFSVNDVSDLASIALLASASRDMACFSHSIEMKAFPEIPESALEITDKANPALPRNDLKKKRLAKRIVARGESMFGQEEEERVQEVCYSSHRGTERIIIESILKCWKMVKDEESSTSNDSIVISHNGFQQAETSAEIRDAAQDIFSSLVFSCDAICENATFDELGKILKLIDFCLVCLAGRSSKLPMETRDGMEASVRTHLGVGQSTVNYSPIRISIVLNG